MSNKILIIDDDLEFGQLLQGVFEQAGHQVHVASRAEEGRSLLEGDAVDLVVTDLRLPNASGIDFLREIRAANIRVPVIMVSGYLDDDGIRELIREGIDGIFMKPLNIFSLLKKATELLEKGPSLDLEDGGIDAEHAVAGIRGLSTRGQAFIKRVEEAKGFRRNLLLIGPPGTPFEEVGREIVEKAEPRQRCLSLKPENLTSERLAEVFTDERPDDPITLLVLGGDSLSDAQAEALIDFADEHGGAAGQLRLIVCLSESVESLYDEERISEDLYMFLGTNELVIPPLKEMPEDLEDLIKREISAHSDDVRFDSNLRKLILEHPWPENLVEARAVIVRAFNLASPLSPRLKHFQAALNPSTAPALSEMAAADTSLERFLRQEKRRYETALDLIRGATTGAE
jgi:DNA-binding NtrC family response regulator